MRLFKALLLLHMISRSLGESDSGFHSNFCICGKTFTNISAFNFIFPELGLLRNFKGLKVSRIKGLTV